MKKLLKIFSILGISATMFLFGCTQASTGTSTVQKQIITSPGTLITGDTTDAVSPNNKIISVSEKINDDCPFLLQNGASLRVDNDGSYGLRFQAILDKEFFNSFSENTTFGIMIKKPYIKSGKVEYKYDYIEYTSNYQTPGYLVPNFTNGQAIVYASYTITEDDYSVEELKKLFAYPLTAYTYYKTGGNVSLINSCVSRSVSQLLLAYYHLGYAGTYQDYLDIIGGYEKVFVNANGVPLVEMDLTGTIFLNSTRRIIQNNVIPVTEQDYGKHLALVRIKGNDIYFYDVFVDVEVAE